MLGSFRLLLAFMVLVNHLFFPLANLMGAHALTAFYMISGYLITLIVNETYKGKNSFLIFLANRALRIYPAYFFVLVLTIIGILIVPKAFHRAYSTIHLPENWAEWAENISLFYLYKADSIMVPPAWTLGIELTFYILLAFVARHRNIIIPWFVISIAWHIYLISQGAPFSERYTPPTAASLFFSTGAMIYWFRDKINFINPGKTAMIALLGVFVALPPIVHFAGFDHTLYGYYISSFLGAVILLLIVRGQERQYFSNPQDKLWGDMAYPVYLFHYFAAGLVNIFIIYVMGIGGLFYFIFSAMITIGLTLIYLKYINMPIENMRTRFRKKLAN